MVRTYVLLAWTWTRAGAAYPLSFCLMVVLGFVLSGLDVAAILVIFANTTTLAGFDRTQVLFLYGTANLAFATCDLLFSNLDRIHTHIKAGTFDTMLIRPASAWIQMATDRFMPTRVGRVAQAAIVLGVTLPGLDIPAGRVWMIPVMVGCGIVIFTALWTLAGALQFALVDAPEVVNAMTYGSGLASQYPMAIYGREMVRGITYVLPLAFINWQPGLYVLGVDDPFGTPEFLRFLGPVAALLLSVAAGLAWRHGIRHYRSTGS
ncbi:ABC transporter permease [Nonomuraea sp. NBC_01738]|uniref:ABC transporter permease n=1 Tax=Nonomuraea sp. NBC_01738 TaxID=2976003 RepID=UPI002E15E3F9|nr:ABC transporter permease [Nonomuraea sp. NBC_01738]